MSCLFLSNIKCFASINISNSSVAINKINLMARLARRSTQLSHPHVTLTHHVFGVDFGTTKATISRINMEELEGIGDSTFYAAKDVLSKIERNSEWPNCQGYSVPMEAYYGPRGSLYVGKSSGEVRGGPASIENHKIPSDASIVRFMKLSLHVSDETRDRRSYLQEQASRLNKRPQDFVQDILVFLRAQCEDINHKEFGTDSVHCVNSYALSVPAAWTNLEQQVFLEKAITAGMQDVSLGSEAEAVTVFTLAKHSYRMMVKNKIPANKSDILAKVVLL